MSSVPSNAGPPRRWTRKIPWGGVIAVVVIALIALSAWLWPWSYFQEKGLPPLPAASDSIVLAPAPAPSAPASAAAVATPSKEKEPEVPTEHRIKQGQTLAKIALLYRKHYPDLTWQLLCVENKLSDCHDIRPDWKLNLVISNETRAKMRKLPRHFFEPKLRYVVIDCAKTKLGYCVFSRPGGDPVCGRDQLGILKRDFNLSKEEVLDWKSAPKERKFIPAGTIVQDLSFGHGMWKGPVLVKQDMWYEEAKIVDQVIGQFDSCCNFFHPPVVQAPPPTPPTPAEPPVVEAPPLPPAPVVPPAVPPITPSPPTVAQVACDEWDVRASAGLELSKGTGTRTGATHADGEVGACPFKWKGKDGAWNEALIAGRHHGTRDDYFGWDGKNGENLLGVGLRRSTSEHSTDLYRLMFGRRTSEGSQGLYAHDARWDVGSLFGTHYRVKPDGSGETHYRWGIIMPFGNAKGSASWDGSPLALPRYKGSLEVGVRRYFDKQGEDWRRFGEINFSLVDPDYKGFGLRAGLCTANDTICGIIGPNIGVDPSGIAWAIGVQINTPGIIRVNRDGVIMERTVKAAEVNGVRYEFAPKGR